jgi:hypothetical protein
VGSFPGIGRGLAEANGEVRVGVRVNLASFPAAWYASVMIVLDSVGDLRFILKNHLTAGRPYTTTLGSLVYHS